jgi:hypothetical protein
MAAQTGPDARLNRAWERPHPHIRRDRRRRQIAPRVEALEGRLVLSGSSPTNPVPIGPEPDGAPNPGRAGAAYQRVVAVETATLRSLGDSYRTVQAAGVQFANRAGFAINQLEAQLRQSQSRSDAHAIAAAIRRDRHLLDVGAADVAREEQGLDVARGLADRQANADKIAIPIGLFTNLAKLVQQNKATGTAISRSGRRSANRLVRELNKLGNQLTSTIPIRTTSSGQLTGADHDD